jgi:hypothetical protein
MANPSGRVLLSLGALEIELVCDNMYPDAMTDMVNRAAQLLGTAIAEAKAANIDVMAIYKSSFVEGDYDDDEEEDA